jgi:hypothetical protein
MKQNENEIITESEVLEEATVDAKAETEEKKPEEVKKEAVVTKTAGDKFMLTAGGAGIVIVVAAIVFILSLSFGSKDDKKDSATTTVTQQSVGNVTIDEAYDNVTFNAAEVTEGISEVEDVVIDSSCRDAVKIFSDCFIFGKTENAESLLPSSVWEDLAKSIGVSKDEFITVVKTNFATNSVAAKVGEGNTVTCEVSSVLVIEETAAEEIRNALSQAHGINKSSITEVYAVSMLMEYTINGTSVSEVDELFCVKIDGVWYLAEKDCLAVYYMLTA